MNEENYVLSADETNTIRELYEKKIALENLAKIISPEENPVMYERMLADYGGTVRVFQNWWTLTIKKHNLPSSNYVVDFDNHLLVRRD